MCSQTARFDSLQSFTHSAQKKTRTSTLFRAADSKSAVSTIPPFGLKGGSDNSLSGYPSGEITPFQARHLPFNQRQETGRELSPSAPLAFRKSKKPSRGFPTRARLMSFRDRLRNQILVSSVYCFIHIIKRSVVHIIIDVIEPFVNHFN